MAIHLKTMKSLKNLTEKTDIAEPCKSWSECRGMYKNTYALNQLQATSTGFHRLDLIMAPVKHEPHSGYLKKTEVLSCEFLLQTVIGLYSISLH